MEIYAAISASSSRVNRLHQPGTSAISVVPTRYTVIQQTRTTRSQDGRAMAAGTMMRVTMEVGADGVTLTTMCNPPMNTPCTPPVNHASLSPSTCFLCLMAPS